ALSAISNVGNALGRTLPRNRERDQTRRAWKAAHHREELLPPEKRLALGRVAMARGQKSAQDAIGAPVAREQEEGRLLEQAQLGADDQLQVRMGLRGEIGFGHPVDAVAV